MCPQNKKRGGELPTLATPPRVGPNTPANPQSTGVGQWGSRGAEAPWQGAVGGVPHEDLKRGELLTPATPAMSGAKNAGEPQPTGVGKTLNQPLWAFGQRSAPADLHLGQSPENFPISPKILGCTPVNFKSLQLAIVRFIISTKVGLQLCDCPKAGQVKPMWERWKKGFIFIATILLLSACSTPAQKPITLEVDGKGLLLFHPGFDREGGAGRGRGKSLAHTIGLSQTSGLKSPLAPTSGL